MMDFIYLNNLKDPAFFIDKNYNIIFMNEKAKEIFGEKTGKKCFEVIYSLQKPCDNLEKCFCPVSRDIFPVKVKNSSCLLIRENECNSEMLFSKGKIALIMLKNEKNLPVENVSESIFQITGYKPEDFLTKISGYSQIIHEEDKKIFFEELKKFCGSKLPYWIHRPYRIKTKSGKKIWVLNQTVPVFDKNKKPVYLYSYIIDINREIEYEKLYRILSSINKVVIDAVTQEDLLKKVCPVLSRELGIPYIWVGGKNKDTFFEFGKKEIDCKPLISENQIKVKNYKRKKYRSVASIPVSKEGKNVAVINLFSKEPDFFDKEKVALLEEIRRDLSFGLEKIENIKESIILREAIEKSTEWVIITDDKGKILYANKIVSNISGYTKEEILNKKINIFKSGLHSEDFYADLWETITSGKEFEATFINKRRDGSFFYLRQKIIPVKLNENTIRFLAIGKDITEELRLARENKYLRFFDQTTNLLNFEGLIRKSESLLKRTRSKAALVVVDIKDFTYLNKVYGIDYGKNLLKAVADRLKKNFRERDIISKIGSDEFAVLITDLKRKEDIFIIENKLKNIFSKPFKIKNNCINLHINAGISVFPEDAENFRKLYENAYLSLNNAKNEGADVIKFFNKDLENRAREILNAKSLIEKAFSEDLFRLYYQPYFKANDLSVAGFESLVRIIDRENRIHLPSEFINYLEISPYIEKFTEWAFSQVTQKINRWKKPIALNISGTVFKKPEFINIIEKYTGNLKKPVILEITERVFVEDLISGNGFIKNMKYIPNIRISIDDFGTGYSALSYLKEIQTDVIKIDISFSKAIVSDPKTKAIIEGVIHIAKSLGIKTVAEGIETKKQLDIYKKIGVDYIQGFYLSKPLDEMEIEKRFI